MLNTENRRLFSALASYGTASCATLQEFMGHGVDTKKRISHYRQLGFIEALPKARGEFVHYQLTAKGEAELLPEDNKPPLQVVPPRTWTPPPVMTSADLPKMACPREGGERAATIRSLGAF